MMATWLFNAPVSLAVWVIAWTLAKRLAKAVKRGVLQAVQPVRLAKTHVLRVVHRIVRITVSPVLLAKRLAS